MKKKLAFMVIITLFIFIVSGCGTKNSSTANSDEIDKLTENIGKTKEEVFKNLNVSEGKEIDIYDDSDFLYVFKEKRKLHGESFDLILTFDIETKEMYGFQYTNNFKNEKDAYELIKKLNDEFNKSYDEPITSPGLQNRIADLPEFDDLWEKGATEYIEMWEKDKILEIVLKIYNVEEKGSLVTVTYLPYQSELDYSGE